MSLTRIPFDERLDRRDAEDAKKLEALTVGERIEVLEKALDILGPDGENWGKGHWFSIRTPGDPMHWRGYVSLPQDANTYCLLGALEEAAYQCGHTQRRLRARRVGIITSVSRLVDKKFHVGIANFNDQETTTFEKVRAVVLARIAQLRSKEE